MRKTLALAAMMVAGCAAFTSCGDDNKTAAPTSDCAINSVVMGTLYRDYQTTLSDGRDSSYVVNVVGSIYPLHIDQINRRVFNSDSLPVGTRINKVVFQSFSADGVIAYRLDSGKDTVFTIKDSIDFTHPRLFTVYSTDGTASRTYTFTLNVRQADPNAFTWTRQGSADSEVAELTDTRMIADGSTLRLWGKSGGAPVAFTRGMAAGSGWTKTAVTGAADIDTRSILSFNSRFYAMADGALAVSADGAAWTPVSSAPINVERLLAAGPTELYAVGEGKVWRSADGAVWTADSLDDSFSRLPQQEVCSAVLTADNNPRVKSVVCVGYTDGQSETWKKEVNLAYSENEPWSYYPITAETPRTLPYLQGLNMIEYDTNLFAFGIADDTVKVYVSNDDVRTWHRSTLRTALPAAIGRPTFATAAADGEGNIWLVCGGTGELWKGFLNSFKDSKR